MVIQCHVLGLFRTTPLPLPSRFFSIEPLRSHLVYGLVGVIWPYEIYWKAKWIGISYAGSTMVLHGSVPPVPDELLVHVCSISEIAPHFPPQEAHLVCLDLSSPRCY